jgi:hypothetical protein
MILKVFRNVSRFQVFIPEKRGWLHYRRSWAEDGVWLCEFNSQDSRRIEKRRTITAAYAEDIWHRFKAKDTCETTYVS